MNVSVGWVLFGVVDPNTAEDEEKAEGNTHFRAKNSGWL